MNGLHQEIANPPYNLEEFLATIESRVNRAIASKEEFLHDGLPVVIHDDLLTVLEGLLKKYVNQDDSNRFLVLFHAYRDSINEIATALAWDKKESHASGAMNVEIAKAIRALWEDSARSEEGDLLLKIAMKLGVIRQNDIERIRDLVGVSESSGSDRI